MSMFFDAADADSDGMLSASEFTLLYTVFQSGDDGLSAEIFHAILDSNGDGEITASEYSNFLNGSGDDSELDFSELESVIEMFDEDGSGGLSVHELDEMLEETGDGDDHGDHHDGHSEDCVSVTAGEVAPADGTFTYSSGETVNVEAGDEAPEDGLYCIGDHDGHEHDDHGDHDGHDHDGHGAAYDWEIDTADTMSETEIIGAFVDYHIVLANCVSEDSDDMMMGSDDMMIGSETMSCGNDVMKVTIAEAMAAGADIMFHDADASGTITDGDMVHINPDIDAGGEWNSVRLYSVNADKYSDENPMMTPGFGAFAGIVALLGAALLSRRD